MKSYAEEKNVTLRTPHKNLPPWQPPKKGSSYNSGKLWHTRVSLKERSINLVGYISIFTNIDTNNFFL